MHAGMYPCLFALIPLNVVPHNVMQCKVAGGDINMRMFGITSYIHGLYCRGQFFLTLCGGDVIFMTGVHGTWIGSHSVSETTCGGYSWGVDNGITINPS